MSGECRIRETTSLESFIFIQFHMMLDLKVHVTRGVELQPERVKGASGVAS